MEAIFATQQSFFTALMALMAGMFCFVVFLAGFFCGWAMWPEIKGVFTSVAAWWRRRKNWRIVE